MAYLGLPLTSEAAHNFAPLEYDWSLNFVRESTRLASAYWEHRRGAGSAPMRSQISPKEMKAFIAHVGLVDIQANSAGNLYTIRQAGTCWETVFGPMTGKKLGEFLSQEIRARWLDVFEAVHAKAAPLRVTSRIAFGGKSWLKMELFVAPLIGSNGETAMLFVAFDAWSDTPGMQFSL